MQGEEGQFKAIADAGFVIDGAQVVFDDLLGSLEPCGDLTVLAALDDEGDDLHFLGSEAVADASAYQVLFRRICLYGVDGVPDFAGGYATDTLDQS